MQCTLTLLDTLELRNSNIRTIQQPATHSGLFLSLARPLFRLLFHIAWNHFNFHHKPRVFSCHQTFAENTYYKHWTTLTHPFIYIYNVQLHRNQNENNEICKDDNDHDNCWSFFGPSFSLVRQQKIAIYCGPWPMSVFCYHLWQFIMRNY